jgi:hypothetical protein
VNRKVSKEEMVARVLQIYSGKARIKKCPKAHSLKRLVDPVSPRFVLGHFTLFFTSFDPFGHWLLKD